MKERFSGRLDFGERSLSPSSGVLAYGSGSGGSESAGVMSEVESEMSGRQAAEERHGRGRRGREGMRRGTGEGERRIKEGNRERHGDGSFVIFRSLVIMAEKGGRRLRREGRLQ